jgi:UDP-glucose 4-epimerase
MRYLIFGGTGSLGKALIDRLGPTDEVVVFSRDEGKHWTIRNAIPSDWGVEFIVGDMRDYQAVERAIKQTNPDTIIIASALKQVGTCENFPSESIKTNILGVQNVVDACESTEPALWMTDGNTDEPITGKRTVLMVSTDKACSPINVYGMCKSIAERVVTERSRKPSLTRYIAVRYGNVLESRGSVIPLFKYLGENAPAITLTHEDMTRFIMTLDDSIDLILDALDYAENGDMWIPKLRAMKIKDLADIFGQKFNKPVEITGIRPGEKLHESLINTVESLRVVSFLADRTTMPRFVVKPAWDSKVYNYETFEYTSEDDLMSAEELGEYLDELGILEWNLSQFKGASIEEIRTQKE